MSGIGGVVSFAQKSKLANEIEKVAAALAPLYPDRMDLWSSDKAAFCHALLHTVPGDRAIQPVQGRSSPLLIVCDARLDNRANLLAALNASDEDAISDAEIILAAYEAWREDTPRKLLGDYAFAIYDPLKNETFVARDPMGMRPFYYSFEPGQYFAFASNADALARISGLKASLNERRVADFLANLEGSNFDSTFYEGVFRLAPGHFFKVGRAKFQCSRFWSPLPKPTLRLPTQDAYIEAFLNVFREAVRCRLRSAGPVASMLSGGIDSNAVTAIADDLLKADGRRLITISAVGPDPDQCTETAMILCALQTKDIDDHTVCHDQLEDFLPRLQELTETSLEPFDATSVHNRAIYLAAHNLGVRVVLDGGAGDVMMHAGNRVASLLAKGSLIKAWKEAKAEREFWGVSDNVSKIYLSSAWATFAPLFLRRLRRQIVGRVRGNQAKTECGRLRSDLVKRAGLAFRRRGYLRYLEAPEPYGSAYLAKVLTHPNLTVGRERYQRIASQLQIECRDPFTDLRVIEFCLSLPPEQFQDAGWPKILLRRTLVRLIPREVVWRKGKTHLGSAFLKAYRKACGKEWTGEVPEALSLYLVSAGDGSQTDPDFVAEELEALARWLSDRGYAG